MLYRTSHHDFNIQMQMHSRTGFPSILFGSKQEDEEKSISLKPGYEYEIRLDPFGQLSTEDFQGLPFEKRQCKLSHELHDNATHPTYTSASCKFDCYVNLAYKTCKCVPWDFVNNIENAMECDLFGRSCFFNVIEKLTHKTEQDCNDCVDECDWIRYRRIKAKSESLALTKNGARYCNRYVCIHPMFL